MKTLSLAFLSYLISLFFLPTESQAPPYEPLGTNHSLLWTAKIGNASFRTNICNKKGFIVIGSNGDYFRDGYHFDRKSGVYLINSSSGNILCSIDNDKWGDFDVNGTIFFNNKIFYGNDNEEFICVDQSGNIIWKNLASGDVEAEPVLIDIKGKKAIVYATELGEVKAVDPESGRSLWAYYTPEFTGWREGENRLVFKVKAFFSGRSSFFIKPVLADVNKDAVLDLIYSSISGEVICLNGSNGSLLWKFNMEGVSFSFFLDAKLVQQKNEFWISSSSYDTKTGKSYLFITRISEKGKLLGKIEVLNSGEGSFALNSLSLGSSGHLYATQDSVFIVENKKVKESFYIGDTFRVKSFWDSEERIVYRNYHDQIFGSGLLKYKGVDSCFILLSQYDRANYKNSFISVISIKDKKVIGRFSLPASGELPPQIGDFNGDGVNELLVNCSDGKLYCYQLN